MNRYLSLMLIKLLTKYKIVRNNELQAKLLYYIAFGRKCNYDNPQTFNEFITVRKNNPKLLDYSMYTDKIAVRDYVKKNSDLELNELYGVWEKPEDIDFNSLPTQFVLKCNHGSGYNIVVKDKSQINECKVRQILGKWLKTNYYDIGRELNYKNIQPRILCEAYLSDIEKQCPEYKAFCFNGKVGFVQVNFWKEGKRYSNIYDPMGSLLPVKYGYDNDPEYIPVGNMANVLSVASNLSREFDFVRVDLYVIKGKIYFSELTFGPGSGIVKFQPESYDYEFGRLFNYET